VTAGPMIATGWSLHLPGIPLAATMTDLLGRPCGAWAHELAVAPENAAAVLGRKGLLAKEPATRLALCAVHRACELAPGFRPASPLSPRTAVVACGNLGNVATVAQATRTIAAQGGRAVSVLDAPNVSSNVIASSVALWFRFGAANMMICSGAAAGLDGLRLAGLLLRAGRADRVVLVGAEPADEVASALHDGDPPLRAGAACVVLETAAAARPAGRRVLIDLVPAGAVPAAAARHTVGAAGFDPTSHWGDFYGARGVIGLALAAHLALDEGRQVVEVRDPGEDAVRVATVRVGSQP